MKKAYFLAIIISISLNSYCQDCNIGVETVPTNVGSNSFTGDYLLGIKYTLSQEGTLKSINLIGNEASDGRVQMVVYDDNSSIPNNLIASSSIAEIGVGVFSLPVTPTLLPAGDYWIMAVYEVSGHQAYHDSSIEKTVYYKSLTFGNAIPTNAANFSNYTGEALLYFLEIDCGNTLSIEQVALSDGIVLYPNPTSNFIEISSLIESEKYRIYTSLGAEVGHGVVTANKKIEIKNLKSGLYFLKLENSKTFKFIKE